MSCVECHNPMKASKVDEGYNFVCVNCGFEYEGDEDDD